MIGGTGNDTYLVDDVGDVIVELAGEGTDTVRSSLSYVLAANFENLILASGAGSINGTGSNLANAITGNEGANTLVGLGGDDALDGGAGADTMVGGTGNDSYIVDSAGDVVVELSGEGVDVVQSRVTYSLGANLESLILMSGAGSIDGTGTDLDNVIAGNEGANTLIGLGGDDSLNGGAGVDIMVGGLGNDTYVVDNVGDAVTELSGEGTDTVVTSVSYTLGTNVEGLTLAGGAGSISGTGNAAANAIVGNESANTLTGLAGDDSLDGGAGADTMAGGAGNDVYTVESTSDLVVELVDEGTDTVISSVGYTLSANVENLTLQSGAGSIGGTGNALANVLLGNTGNNALNGLAGDDYIIGGTGNDTIDGGAGVDTVVFGGPRSNYQVVWDFDYVQVMRTGDSAVLYNVEKVSFSDGVVSVDSFAPPAVTIEAAGMTRLVEIGNHFFLRDAGGAGPYVKFQGGPVVDAQFGAWKALGTEQTASGYQVAWKNGGANEYLVWSLDSGGNYVGNATAVVAGSDMALQTIESAFQQDLNEDGRVGLATTTIEAFGATSLVEVGNQYFLREAGGAGPALKHQGAAITEGQFGAWTAIGAEQTAGGFQAAFKNGSADQYIVWNLDGNGNYVGNATAVVAGSDPGFQALETAFQQDLNGNGRIGLVTTTTTIEAFGVTSLVEVGTQYFLHGTGGAGPSLKHQGAAITEGQFGAWTAIGAEQTAGGYQAAFKNGAADQYVVWNLDGNGNYLGNATAVVAGSDSGFQALETVFQQDLNGNGRIGLVTTTTTIEAFGATSLVQVGSQYFMRESGGAGPSIKYQGAALTEGQFGAWTAIGAEQRTSGYQAVFKNGAADQYVVWNLDGNGNYLGNATAVVAGADRDLQALESVFQQDLNGNGLVGSALGTLEAVTTEAGTLHLTVAMTTFSPPTAIPALSSLLVADALVPPTATGLIQSSACNAELRPL